MTGYEVSVGTDLLPGLLNGQDGLAKLVEAVLNQVLEAQVTETLGATRHERTDERAGYRNGYRPRTLYTRVGPVTLLVPQTRDGSFSTDIFKRYQRSEQAFVLALMEMVVHGVSTRKVSAITEEPVRRQLLQIDGERTVRRTGTAGQRVQRTAAGRRVSLRAGRCPVHQESARRSCGFACRADRLRHPRRWLPGDSGRADRRHRELRHLGRDLPLAQRARPQGHAVHHLGRPRRPA